MRMNFLKAAMCLTIAIGLCACGGGGGGGSDGASTSVPAPVNGTISNFTVGENSVHSSPQGDGTASHRPAMAVKLTPTSYPVTLTSVTIYPTNNTGSDQTFNLYGFSDLSTETQIFSPVLNQTIPDTGTSYYGKTIAIPPTTISSGSFYIAVEWVTKPLTSSSGANAFFIRKDGQLDHLNATFYRFTGTTWVTAESIGSTYGDIGIFASYGNNATGEKPLVASVNPANGAFGVDRNIQEIEIQFNKEMGVGVSVAGDANWPLSNGTATRWSSDHKTFYISRDNAGSLLPAVTMINTTFNGAGHPANFMDIFGNTLDTYAYSFTTGP